MRDSIYLLPLGEILDSILDQLSEGLNRVFRLPVRALGAIPDPSYAFQEKRCQYFSARILKELAGRLPDDGLRILGIAEVDLCTPVLTFVFGEAQLPGVSALISLTRLRREFYRLPADEAVLATRSLKEAIHELGHTFGLVHCRDAQCVEHFSPDVLSIDQKRTGFCPECEALLVSRLPSSSK